MKEVMKIIELTNERMNLLAILGQKNAETSIKLSESVTEVCTVLIQQVEEIEVLEKRIEELERR